MIKSIFESSLGAAGFTHVPGHGVSGITLPPDDATYLFEFSLRALACFQGCEEDWFIWIFVSGANSCVVVP